jgi:hypothetical protein
MRECRPEFPVISYVVRNWVVIPQKTKVRAIKKLLVSMELTGGTTPAWVVWSVVFTRFILVWLDLDKHEVSHEAGRRHAIVCSIQCLAHLILEYSLSDHMICHN